MAQRKIVLTITESQNNLGLKASQELIYYNLPPKTVATRMLHHIQEHKELLFNVLLTSDVLHKSHIPAKDTLSGKKGIKATYRATSSCKKTKQSKSSFNSQCSGVIILDVKNIAVSTQWQNTE